MRDRRSVLRDLVTLPLIGGGVTLIGSPVRAAVPATDEHLALYGAFMLSESQAVLRHFQAQGRPIGSVLSDAWADHGHLFPQSPALAHRVPVILSAAGVPLSIGGAA